MRGQGWRKELSAIKGSMVVRKGLQDSRGGWGCVRKKGAKAEWVPSHSVRIRRLAIDTSEQEGLQGWSSHELRSSGPEIGNTLRGGKKEEPRTNTPLFDLSSLHRVLLIPNSGKNHIPC